MTTGGGNKTGRAAACGGRDRRLIRATARIARHGPLKNKKRRVPTADMPPPPRLSGATDATR
jgi:hypothetical protein